MALKEQQIYYMVGFPKAGSTLMRSFIKRHPEVNYIYDDSITRLITGNAPLVEYDEASSRKTYLEILDKKLTNQCNVIADETLVGTFYSGHYDAKINAERIYKFSPVKPKIILTIREQRKALSSYYRHYVSRGGVRSYGNFLLAEPSRRKPGFSWVAYKYDTIIGHYIDLFGLDSVCVLPVELATKDPKRYIEIICNFLGVSSIEYDVSIQNKGISEAESIRRRFMNTFNSNEQYDDVRDRSIFSNRAYYILSWPIGVAMYYVWTVLGGSIDCFIDKKFEGKYKESNRKLQNLIGIDLSLLGYDV